MTDIRRYPVVRHIRTEPSSYVLHFRRGRLVRSGRGLAFAFRPSIASLVLVPMDDRELELVFHGRTSDFQDVTAQGVVTFRVDDPQLLADRIDFSVDLATGTRTSPGSRPGTGARAHPTDRSRMERRVQRHESGQRKVGFPTG